MLQAAGAEECLVHTGQHYDGALSQIFFEELGIPQPMVNLGVGSGTHAEQTAAMLTGIERVIKEQLPSMVLVYGDTNSTLAGALAAAKLNVPVAHVEAGLRSFNRAMPEEHNRVIADHCSSLLFCPTATAVENLAAENITRGVHLVGDVMYEAFQAQRQRAQDQAGILESVFGTGQSPPEFLLATIHRPQNTDEPDNLNAIMAALNSCGCPVVLPLHPRTTAAVEQHREAGRLRVEFSDSVRVIEPVGYLDMLRLMDEAKAILTDSGGVQKEAAWLETPCITLREETEWVETVEAGWNVLVGASTERILDAITQLGQRPPEPMAVVNESPAAAIVDHIRQGLR
jgi:UDP-N-acetylglucosamine 2-epimerase (non-hydrolysing)